MLDGPGGGRCPWQRGAPVVRCASVDERCTSDADCPAGRACCYHQSACIRACLPACEPACDACQVCEFVKGGGRAVCLPPAPELQCPYDPVGPLVRCSSPRVDTCSSNFDCPSGQACCYRVCNDSCQPACPAPCPDGQRCILQEELGVSSCQVFPPLQ